MIFNNFLHQSRFFFLTINLYYFILICLSYSTAKCRQENIFEYDSLSSNVVKEQMILLFEARNFENTKCDCLPFMFNYPAEPPGYAYIVEVKDSSMTLVELFQRGIMLPYFFLRSDLDSSIKYSGVRYLNVRNFYMDNFRLQLPYTFFLDDHRFGIMYSLNKTMRDHRETHWFSYYCFLGHPFHLLRATVTYIDVGLTKQEITNFGIKLKNSNELVIKKMIPTRAILNIENVEWLNPENYKHYKIFEEK